MAHLLPDYRVLSRGTQAWNVGRGADRRMVAAADAAFGIDLMAHRASQFQMGDLDWADIVFAPDKCVVQELADLGAGGSLVRLMMDDLSEIADPYGGDDRCYAAAAELVVRATERICDWLSDCERSGFRNIATTGPGRLSPGYVR